MTISVSLRDTTVIMNDHTVVGWSSDNDALMMPSEVEISAVDQGADGKLVASHTGIVGGPVSFKLQANSPSTAFFAQQVAQQQRGAAVTWDGTIVNARTGVTTSCQRGVLMTVPLGQTLGSGAAPARVFMIHFELIVSNYDAASFVNPPEITATV